MADVRIRVADLWKKFHRGEVHDSLRDLIPAIARRWLGRGPRREQLGDGDFWALREVEFEVAAGEALGVIGPNGAGKSTLLKILSRILRPNRGHVEVSGRVGALIEISAGFHPDLTGRENIYLQGAINGMRRPEIAAKFDDIVAFSGIEDFIDTPVKRYSSGMNARLGFSIATSLEQEVLLIDEVLSVGDWRFQQQCNLRMQQLVESGAAVIFISHNHRAVVNLCNRTLLLQQGENVALGPSGDVIREHLAGSGQSTAPESAPLRIERVSVEDPTGTEKWDYEPGEEARARVQLAANEGKPKLNVVLFVRDYAGYTVFNTSSVRLEHPFGIEAGQTHAVTFALELHLTRGEYQLGVEVRDSGNDEIFDQLFPAATLHIRAGADVAGTSHLYPRILDGPAE